MKSMVSVLMAMLLIPALLQASGSEGEVALGSDEHVTEVLVLGAVRNPGFHSVKGAAAIRLHDAIALAGGLTKDALESHIRILRPKLADDGKNTTYSTVQLKSLPSGGHDNPELEEGDIVFVPATEDVRFPENVE